jgi:transposase InsO family protein
MGQRLHGSARTTAAVRRAIQHRQARIATLAERYHLNPKTVAKWKTRTHVHDAPMGPKTPRSTVLTLEEAALVIRFRTHPLLALDDCLSALQPTIPHLTRASLPRCWQRHDISRLPEVEGDKPAKKPCKPYPMGDFPIDIAEVSTEEGKRRLFGAIDRSSTYASAELHTAATKMVAAQFLRHLIAAVPDKLHTVLTDNGIQFTNRSCDQYAFRHIVERVCGEQGLEPRRTKGNHPWTNGQVERMHRTLQEAPVKNYDDQTHPHLKDHLHTFQMADNVAKRLKTLKGLPPYEDICHCWQKEPERCTVNPCHHTVGLNT